MTSAGTLVLVATPIGNLGDLSPRAVEEFTKADVVCCEDTRRSGRLLQHAGVRARELCVVNEHTEHEMIDVIVARLAGGQRVVLITDAGTPGISDPGERLVAAAVAAGHAVLVVPGPSAVIAALVVSGLPTSRFVFEGFLPRKGNVRAERLRDIARQTCTVVCYEAPHRLARTLADLVAACGGDRRVAIAREITKLHEEVWRGSLDDAVLWASAVEPRGEYVLVIDAAPAKDAASDEEVLDALRGRLADGMSVKDASNAVAIACGRSRRDVYELAHSLPRAQR